MTIREQIQTTLRALAEIPAVVELAREANLMRRTHVETALRLQLAKKQAHIERLQYRCSKCGADVAKALRDMAKWREQAVDNMRRAEGLVLKLDDARNEIGPSQALIAEKNRQLESCSARIRELETKLAETRMVRDEMAKIVNDCEPKTMADLWRPIGDEEWLDRNGKYLLLCDDRGTFSVRAGAAVTSVGTIWSSYIVLEPPR